MMETATLSNVGVECLGDEGHREHMGIARVYRDDLSLSDNSFTRSKQNTFENDRSAPKLH